MKDSGPGLKTAGRDGHHEGVGFANTQARLRQLYSESHTFEVRNAEGGGFEVNISLPYRASGAENDAPGFYEDSHSDR